MNQKTKNTPNRYRIRNVVLGFYLIFWVVTSLKIKRNSGFVLGYFWFDLNNFSPEIIFHGISGPTLGTCVKGLAFSKFSGLVHKAQVVYMHILHPMISFKYTLYSNVIVY